MLGDQLYPTPSRLRAKLLQGIDWHKIDSILEPEAGKGDLAIEARECKAGPKQGWHHDDDYDKQLAKVDIDCIEIDPNLQSVLKGLKFRVVHDDFLTFNTFKKYSLVIQNPPFLDGDAHLLKAIDLQRRGGLIRCLLNAETLRNPFSNTRKQLVQKLHDLNAEIEYIEGAFVGAERNTDVEVALVKIDIPQTEGPSIIQDHMRRAKDAWLNDDEVTAKRASAAIVSSDPMTEAIERYNNEAEMGLWLINEGHKLRKVGSGLLTVTMGDGRESHSATGNDFIAALRTKYWRDLIANPKFTAILTSDLQARYLAEIPSLAGYEFTRFNILQIYTQFVSMAQGGIEKAITDLFDTLSHENHYNRETQNGNVHYFNGWHANSAWKINEKVIRPQSVYGKFYGSRRWTYESRACQELSDIAKVFAFLDGRPVTDIDTVRLIEAAVNAGQTANIDTPYFIITLYLKGTCHIKFKRKDLLKKFNIYGAQGKHWLPTGYGKSKYADMTPMEQAVVDSFEGDAEYAKTLDKRDFYIVAPERLLQIGAAV